MKKQRIFHLRFFGYVINVSFKVFERKLGRDVVVVTLQEPEDIASLFSLINILANALACMVKRYARLIDMAVAFRYVVYLIVAHAGFTKNVGVNTEVRDRIVCHHNIRRHVAGHSASTFHKYEIADFIAFVNERTRRENTVVPDLAVAGYLHSVAEYAPIANPGIMPYVRLCHHIGAIAYYCGLPAMDAPVYYDVLPNYVVVAELYERRFSFPAEVLWSCRDYRSFVNAVVFSDSCTGKYAGMGVDEAVIGDLYVAVNVDESSYRHVVAKFSFRMYECKG